MVEVEFTLVELCRAGQPPTERVQTNNMSIHLTNAVRECIELVLQPAFRLRNIRLLFFELMRPLRNAPLRTVERTAHPHAGKKNPGEQRNADATDNRNAPRSFD